MQLFKCAAILLLTGYALAMTRLQVEQRMGLMESNFKKSGDVGAPAPLPPIKKRDLVLRNAPAMQKRDWLPPFTFDDSNLVVRFRLQAYAMTALAMENLLVAAFDTITNNLGTNGNARIHGGRWTVVDGDYQFTVQAVGDHGIWYREVFNVICAMGVSLVHGHNGDLPYENSFSVTVGATEVASGEIVRLNGK